MTSKRLESLRENEQAPAGEFGAEWLRLAPARQFAAMLVGHRAHHGLSQRELARRLGVSQPRVARMESGEHNPDFETIVAAVGALGTEFMLYVAPAETETQLMTKMVRSEGSVVTHGEVTVVTASSPTRPGERRTQRASTPLVSDLAQRRDPGLIAGPSSQGGKAEPLPSRRRPPPREGEA